MANPVHVKICGLTRPEDARLAADLGASAIGMVFWPGSPRCIDVATARRIVSVLPPLVGVVGLFVNQPADEVVRVANEVPLTLVQLHGSEPLDYCAAIPRRVIKAVAVAGKESLDAVADLPDWVTVLLDAHDPARFGGTGRTIEWSLAAGLARERRVILSGGLTAENVESAIVTVRPYAVDVSSGVEAAPGIKDAVRLRAFFTSVHRTARVAEVPEG